MKRPRPAPRVYQCQTCGYRETISGPLAAASMLKCVSPGCKGGGEFEARMARITYQRADGTEYAPEWAPGMVPVGADGSAAP